VNGSIPSKEKGTYRIIHDHMNHAGLKAAYPPHDYPSHSATLERCVMNDFDGGFPMQMFSQLAAKGKHHGQRHIADVVAYVKEGRKSGFD
jgi:hypothetical protein